MHAEPLARHRVPILQSRVADAHLRRCRPIARCAAAANAVFMPRFSTVSSRCSPLPEARTRRSPRRGNPRARCASAPTARARHARARAWSRAHEQAHRLRGDAFATAGEAELLGGRRLDADRVDVDAEIVGEVARASRRRAARSSGRSQTTVTSALPTRQPRSRSNALQWRRKTRLSASFHCGSDGGKWRPMSPSASAPSMASHSAWITTSPSLCAIAPRSKAMRTPPSTSGRPRRRRARRSHGRCGPSLTDAPPSTRSARGPPPWSP